MTPASAAFVQQADVMLIRADRMRWANIFGLRPWSESGGQKIAPPGDRRPSVHRARDEAVDVDVSDRVPNPAWSVPDLSHRTVRSIWFGPAAAKIIDESLGRDIIPLCADSYLIAAFAVRLLDGPPLIVTQNVPVGSPATHKFRNRLNVAFPPEMLGVIRTDAGRRQGQRRCRQQSEDDGGKSRHLLRMLNW